MVMASDADLSDFKVMTCTDESRRWPRSSSEVPAVLIDEYLDHAEECAYHAQLMLLEQRQMEQELRMKIRLARGLDRQGCLLKGTMLVQAIAENESRLANWNKESDANFPFNQIALYNGGRLIASCGNFFDFSRHESINELDSQAGLQIRGINRSDEGDVLLGSYALAGVRHDGEEQMLPLKNGYTVGLRVIRLDDKTFTVGFRCVDSASMEKLSYRQDFAAGGGRVSDCISGIENPSCPSRKRLGSAAWYVSLKRMWLALVDCGRAVHWSLENRTSSFFKALTEKPNVVQLGATLLLVVLLIEGAGSLRQLASRSNEVALEAQSLFLYSDSDLVQMLTVERLIDGSSFRGETVRIGGNTQLRRRFRATTRVSEPPRSLNAAGLFCRGRRRCDAAKAKASVVAANVRH
jgi:hypothetical protein